MSDPVEEARARVMIAVRDDRYDRGLTALNEFEARVRAEAVREWETAVREVLEFEVTGDEIAHIECSKTSWELSACSCGLEAAIARLRALLPEFTEGGE